MVFRSDSFKKLIDDGELIYLVADWTNYDPLITKELERYKRGGVPLYLYWKALFKIDYYYFQNGNYFLKFTL